MEQKIKTLGESRLESKGLLSENSVNYINTIKNRGAELIDFINSAVPNPQFSGEQFGEWKRLQSLALTDIEKGIMWAVKAESRRKI